jgi:sugar phosphate isomerase/epimerase
MSKFPVAIQLYSVRDFMEKDVEATIKKVAEIGYDGVEFAGTFGYSAADLKAICEKYGVTPISAHVPIKELENDLENTVAYYKELGCEYIAIPWIGEEYRNSEEALANTYKTVEKIGAYATESGMTLLYHNHDFEFKKVGDDYILDLLYSNVPATKLKTQLDTCWVKVGGENPAEYVRKYSGRAPVVHLKDFAGQKGNGPLYKLIGIEEEETAASADPVIDGLVAARTAAKKEKNFAEADRIRDELKAMGVEIIDTPQGTKWRKV